MVEDPQSGFLHRHLVVPFVVVPFFFICPVHTGHRGLFGVTGKANQHPATTLKRRSGGLNEKRARIRTKSLFKPDLYSLICGNRKNQTHILLLNPPAACVGVTALAREVPGFRTSQSPSSRCCTTRLLGFPMMLFPFFYMNSCGSAEFGSFGRFGTRVNFGCGSSMPARRRT